MKKMLGFLLTVGLLCFSFSGAFSAANDRSNDRQNSIKKPSNLLYLPLDERFTTRELFLSDALVTPFHLFDP